MNNRTDYSLKTSWYQIPEITKDVDTIYVYATEYMLGSFEEGSADYADLDNEEMRQSVSQLIRRTDHKMGNKRREQRMKADKENQRPFAIMIR